MARVTRCGHRGLCRPAHRKALPASRLPAWIEDTQVSGLCRLLPDYRCRAFHRACAPSTLVCAPNYGITFHMHACWPACPSRPPSSVRCAIAQPDSIAAVHCTGLHCRACMDACSASIRAVTAAGDQFRRGKGVVAAGERDTSMTGGPKRWHTESRAALNGSRSSSSGGNGSGSSDCSSSGGGRGGRTKSLKRIQIYFCRNDLLGSRVVAFEGDSEPFNDIVNVLQGAVLAHAPARTISQDGCAVTPCAFSPTLVLGVRTVYARSKGMPASSSMPWAAPRSGRCSVGASSKCTASAAVPPLGGQAVLLGAGPATR